jgi:RNA polymerase sigma-70 factor, ECF subfamily
MFGSEIVLVLLALSGSSDLDDPELARRIRAGDREAFRAFFERHHAALFQFLRRRGAESDDAEDLVQNAFIMIWERRHTIDPSRSLRAFLFQSAYRRALNLFRDTARFDRSADAEETAAGELNVEGMGMHDALMKAVDALPERRRMVFELTFLRELTYREAAEVLGISVKTVENQMAHALKSIRSAIEVYR